MSKPVDFVNEIFKHAFKIETRRFRIERDSLDDSWVVYDKYDQSYLFWDGELMRHRDFIFPTDAFEALAKHLKEAYKTEDIEDWL